MMTADELYQQAFRAEIAGLKPASLCDVGCGTGALLAHAQSLGIVAAGVEPDPAKVAEANGHGLDIRQGIFDGSQFESGYFDYVTLDQVAEHVTDPHALMRGVARVLKPGGKVVVTTPNPNSLGARVFGRKWLNWHVPYHIQFYTPQSLQRLAREAGLTMVCARTATHSEWQYYQWVHAMQFPERGRRSAFWSPGRVEPKRRRILDFLVDNARRFRLHRPITRVLDALGLGDNHVFILQKP